MSWLSEWFHGGKSPSDAASKYTNQIPKTIEKYGKGAFERGERAGSALEDALSKYLNPQDYYNEIMSGYMPSEAYKFKQARMSDAAANTAAAGGMRGTAADQLKQQELTQSLLSSDMQDYLKNILGIESTGLQGEEDLYGKGTDVGRGMSSDLANYLNQMGDMAYREQMQKNQAPWDALKGIGGIIGGIAGLPTGWLSGSGSSSWLNPDTGKYYRY